MKIIISSTPTLLSMFMAGPTGKKIRQEQECKMELKCSKCGEKILTDFAVPKGWRGEWNANKKRYEQICPHCK